MQSILPRALSNAHIVVEINLRDTSMLHGKKCFERIVWSFTNILKNPAKFIFCDLGQVKSSNAFSSTPCPILAALLASPCEAHVPQITSSQPVLVPSFYPPPGSKIYGGGESQEAEYQREVWREWGLHVFEWLALASLGPADRINASDSIDPYLSTYSVEQEKSEESGQAITRMTFRGIIPATWVGELWKDVWQVFFFSPFPFSFTVTVNSNRNFYSNLLSLTVEGKKGWATLSVHGFENSPISWNNSAHGSLNGGENGYTILRLPLKAEKDESETGRYIIYEVVGSQDEHS